MKSTPKQRQFIGSYRSMLGMCEDVYREILSEGYGVNSSKDLTFEQASNLIQALKIQAVDCGVYQARNTKNSPTFGNREGFASEAQLKKIYGMWKDVSILNTPEARSQALNELLKRVLKIDNVRFLRTEDVNKVIKLLSAMKAAKNRKGA